MIAKLCLAKKSNISADKFVAKCPKRNIHRAILEANSINQDTYKFWNINESL